MSHPAGLTPNHRNTPADAEGFVCLTDIRAEFTATDRGLYPARWLQRHPTYAPLTTSTRGRHGGVWAPPAVAEIYRAWLVAMTDPSRKRRRRNLPRKAHYTIAELAEHCGISAAAIRRRLIAYGYGYLECPAGLQRNRFVPTILARKDGFAVGVGTSWEWKRAVLRVVGI